MRLLSECSYQSMHREVMAACDRARRPTLPLTVTESVIALIVTIQVSRYSKVALNVLAVQIWLFTVPPTFL